MWYKCEADKTIINVYVQPGAKHTEIAGLHGDALKIRLNVQPIDGRANDALLNYLASWFEVPVRQVSLKRGDKCRRKVVVITGSRINPDIFQL
jgi:uncharacterized protein (TIGR00251 family)